MSRKIWTRVLLLSVAVAIGIAVVLLRAPITLLSISVPIYTNSVVHAREAVLRDELFTMRSVIHQYTLDKQERPRVLQDLVSAGYLKAIPKDPFTNSSATWGMTPDGDVHSGAIGVGSDGKPYSSW